MTSFYCANFIFHRKVFVYDGLGLELPRDDQQKAKPALLFDAVEMLGMIHEKNMLQY